MITNFLKTFFGRQRRVFLAYSMASISFLGPFEALVPVVPPVDFLAENTQKVMAEKEMDLTNRYPQDQWVNEVFSDNILLALHYLKGDGSSQPDWEKIRQSFEVSFVLQPGEVFAFHDNLLPEYQKKVAKTLNSHFTGQEGYRNDGWLIGDGVCHLASLFNWVASEAGLKVEARANHDFRLVPGIPREFGTSIMSTSKEQNLYLENSFNFPVRFIFTIKDQKVKIKIVELEM